jgi:magnesium transporter
MDEPPSRGSEPLTDSKAVYLSELLGASMKSRSGRTLARVKDVVASVSEDVPTPVVNGFVVRATGHAVHFVPWTSVSAIAGGRVELIMDEVDPRAFERRPGEMLLARDLRDKEVVHVDGKRVVRANDLQLIEEDGHLVVTGVDVSAAALVAQLGLGGFARRHMRREVLPWEDVEIFEAGLPVPLHLFHDKIARLHPADIAKVIHDLGYRQSSELLEDLPYALAADVVEDLAPEYQATLLSSLDREHAADILEEMPPDAAADVLNDIVEDDPEAADELVRSMETEEAAEVERLRSYKGDTAGGLMTTEFVMVPANLTAAQALELLRGQRESLPAHIDPIFVVAPECGRKLAGVLSLKALSLAEPEERVEDLMQTEVVSLYVDDSARDAARAIAHYNLSALPILDEKDELVGVVPINQAMDLILPREWLRRMPRPFIGGHSMG